VKVALRAALIRRGGFGAVKAKLVRIPNLDFRAHHRGRHAEPRAAETAAPDACGGRAAVGSAGTALPEPAKETVLADDVKQRLAAADRPSPKNKSKSNSSASRVACARARNDPRAREGLPQGRRNGDR